MDATVAADYTKFIVEEHHLIGKMLKLPSFRIPKFNSRTGGHSHGELSSSEWCDLLQAGVESMHNALLQTRVMQHLCSFAWSHIYCRVQKDSQQVCDYAKHTHTHNCRSRSDVGLDRSSLEIELVQNTVKQDHDNVYFGGTASNTWRKYFGAFGQTLTFQELVLE